MKKSQKRLGEILVERGVITEAQLREALLEQKFGDKKLGLILTEKGFVTAMSLADALAQQFNLPLVDIKAQHIDFELARRFSSALVIDHACFPLKEEEFSFTVAIANPLDGVGLSRLIQEALPKSVSLVIAPEPDVQAVLQGYRKYISMGIQRMLKQKRIQGIGGA
jgi:type IV pilus assembly protein PilB